jgi:glycosyltransferase involved in cell wall biosynthesis
MIDSSGLAGVKRQVLSEKAEASRLKILHVIGSVDARGGGTTDHVYSSSQVWSRLGHECHVLCLDPPDAPCVLQSPITTIALGSHGVLHDLARRFLPVLRYGYTPKLTSWLKSNAKNYDAIILNGLWNYTSYGSWRALRKTSVPYFVCPHGMLDPWLKDTYPIRHLFKVIFWNLFEWKVLRDTCGVFFACDEERRLAQYFLSSCESREFVVAYGTQEIPGDADTQRSAFLKKYPHLEERKLILFLSRIHPKKGLDLLIRAFARHGAEFPEFDLMIVGPDQVGLTPQLKKIAVELRIEDRIHWAGMLTGDEKWGAFRTAAFFVLPSHQENFGIAVAEAMALSLPVLITNKVNIWQEVESDGAGYVTVDGVDEISQGLQHLCSLTDSQLSTMGRNARACFVQRFNLEKNAAKFADLMVQFTGPAAVR